MKRTILMAAAVFVVAMLAGIGGRVALTHPSAGKKGTAADSTKAGIETPALGDSSRAGGASTHPDLAGIPQRTDSVAASLPVTEAFGAAATPGMPGPEPAPGMPDPAAPASKVGDATKADSLSSPSADAEAAAKATKLVARILVTMKGADAGKIMEGLTDDEVEGILRAVGVRQAAGLLPLLPTERASRLSRRLLENHPKEGK
jgi:hypothetical protein